MSKEYTCLGMMSGTSGDGVDASIIQSNGIDKLNTIKEKYYEYNESIFSNLQKLKKKINIVKDLERYKDEINNLENKITLFHAKVFKDISEKVNLDLIGFHGQTLLHNPKEKISLQLGNGKLLSQETRKDIVYNFRKNDIQNNGEGAPLSPIFHLQIVKDHNISLPACILNIGGISNATYFEDLNEKNMISRDIGPGNCLIDSWVRANTNNKFDFEGKISSKGQVNEIILEQSLEIYENSMQKINCSSFDVNDFDISFVRGLSIEDGAATLTEFTSKIISSSLKEIFNYSQKKNISIFICGGGRKNKILVSRIKQNFQKNIDIRDIDTLNINGDFIESQAFAYLAIRSLLQLPISYPKTTGCSSPCIGGQLIKY